MGFGGCDQIPTDRRRQAAIAGDFGNDRTTRRKSMQEDIGRRSFVRGAGVLAGVAVAASLTRENALAQSTTRGPEPMTYDIKPLPFDPKNVRGLSEKLLTSHYENNYGGAVKRLNAITQQLAEL
jgi:superoxide dismutase, Fe-Mn family